MSTPEQNKALARRYNQEVDNGGDFSHLDDFFAPNYVLHLPGYPPVGREGYQQVLEQFRNAFTGFAVTFDEQVAEGDFVVNRWTTRGTHTGNFNGIPATGKTIEMTGMNIQRFENGKIAEHWGVFDTVGLMQQLGVIPTP
jgi:steroid delta-isomerase-like uncharacterized protein